MSKKFDKESNIDINKELDGVLYLYGGMMIGSLLCANLPKIAKYFNVTLDTTLSNIIVLGGSLTAIIFWTLYYLYKYKNK